jgi:hypothetical protein
VHGDTRVETRFDFRAGSRSVSRIRLRPVPAGRRWRRAIESWLLHRRATSDRVLAWVPP